MYALKIYSDDFPEPLHDITAGSTTSGPTAKNPNNLRLEELRCVVHLVGKLDTPSGNTLDDDPSAGSTQLFMVALPDYFFPHDFIGFCISHVPEFSELLFLRSRDEKRKELKEKIRDLRACIELQRTIANMDSSYSVNGGTFLKIVPKQS